MDQRWMRRWLALVLGLAFFLSGLAQHIPAPVSIDHPGVAIAGDATVAVCTEAAFDAALNAVQSTGGGTITFSCAGTITFTGSKSITSHVTIEGGTTITLDGGNATRLFTIDAGATLILKDIVVQNGSAGAGTGGAFINAGTLHIVRSDITGNAAQNAGAIQNTGGTVTITASNLTGNTAGPNPGAQGGGIHNSSGGLVEIFKSQIVGNGGILGGAFYNASGTVTIVASHIEGNTAFDGGVIYNRSTFNLVASFLTLNSASGGSVLFSGGSVSTSTMTANVIDGNSGGLGGIVRSTGGTVTLNDSTVVNNDAVQGAFAFNVATLNINRSIFRNNQALGVLSGSGGVVHTIGSTLRVNASTFEGNHSTVAGGAISGNGFIDIRGSTFANNTAGAFGGAISNFGAGTTVRGSVFYNNTAPADPTCRQVTVGDIASAGSNLLDDASCSFTQPDDIQNSATINLDVPAHNGSPTETMALLAGSAALDSADCTDSTTTDQRGVTRPVPPALTCDRGAFEASGLVPVRVYALYTISGPVPEVSPADLEAVAYGPAGAVLDYDFDCDNDGSYETQGVGAGNLGTATCNVGDDPGSTVNVQVCDGGNCATGSTVVTVINLNPVVTSVTNNGPINEASNASITVTASDPAGALDPLMYAFDCDNDSVFEIGPQAANNALCAFPDDGNFTVTVQVTDDDGGVGIGSTVVTVNNVDPTINSVTNDGPVAEGSSATVTVNATDPAGINDPLAYEFDCDNDAAYEVGPQPDSSTDCTFLDDGDYTVNVRVTDGDDGAATDSTVVMVFNIVPTIETVTISPSPSDEAQSITVTATFSDPGALDTHTCTVDFGDGNGPQAGTVVGTTCTGPNFAYPDDDPSGTSQDNYTIAVTVFDDEGDFSVALTAHTVQNVPPTIDAITTNDPVPQGQPVTVTVSASDPGGAGDPLMYSFDCDDNGVYEIGPQVGNSTMCPLDPAAASTTFNVLVEDDDLGSATGEVVVEQVATVCLSYATGQLTETGPGGTCSAGQIQLSLPAPYPITICRSINTNALRWSPTGICTVGEWPHVVPDDGPLYYCEHSWTHALRWTFVPFQCLAHEIPGVIPG